MMQYLKVRVLIDGLTDTCGVCGGPGARDNGSEQMRLATRQGTTNIYAITSEPKILTHILINI